MIYVRKEGDKVKPGFNVMWHPWVQCYLMLCTYRHRVYFGIGWSRIRNKLHFRFERWTLDDDLKNAISSVHVFPIEYVAEHYTRNDLIKAQPG